VRLRGRESLPAGRAALRSAVAGSVRWLDPAASRPRRKAAAARQARPVPGAEPPGLGVSLRKGFAVSGDVSCSPGRLFNILNRRTSRFANQSLNFSGGGFGLLIPRRPAHVQLGMRLTF